MEAYISIFLYICFVVMGMRILRSSFQSLFSMQIHRGLINSDVKGIKTVLTGMLGSLFLLSTSVYNRLVLNLLPGRLIAMDKAMNLCTGSLFGSFVLALLFMQSHIVAAVVLMLIGSLGIIWTNQNRGKLFFRIFFGFGLI